MAQQMERGFEAAQQLAQQVNFPEKFSAKDLGSDFFGGVGGEVRFPKVLGREVFMCFFGWKVDFDITMLT